MARWAGRVAAAVAGSSEQRAVMRERRRWGWEERGRAKMVRGDKTVSAGGSPPPSMGLHGQPWAARLGALLTPLGQLQLSSTLLSP